MSKRPVKKPPVAQPHDRGCEWLVRDADGDGELQSALTALSADGWLFHTILAARDLPYKIVAWRPNR